METFICSRAPGTTEAKRTAVREWGKAALARETDKGLRDRLTLVIAHTGDRSVVLKGAEVVDAKYVVPRLEPLLYANPMPFQEFDMLAWAGGPDGDNAINRFVAASSNANSSSIVEHARSVLAKSKAAQTSE